MAEHKHNGYIYQVNENARNTKELFKIISDKHKVIPESLYKYYKINDYSIDSFLNHYVYASHPLDLNDPFDCNRNLISFEKSTLEDFIIINNGFYPQKEIEKLYKSNDPDDRTLLDEIFKKYFHLKLYTLFGIYSLTGKSDSMEMWTYYAEHKGFVLKFKLKYLPQNYMGPFPINYTNDFKELDYSKFKNSSVCYQTNIKAQCWDHEDEWRLIFYSDYKLLKFPCFDAPNAHNRKFYYDQKAIEEVIFGLSFFDMCEYVSNFSTKQEELFHLKKNKKRKRKILRYVLSQGYKTSMMQLNRNSNNDIVSREVKIIKISTNRYKIRYI